MTIGSHVFELPDEEASVLGEAAMIQSRKGGWISPTDDLLIAVTPATEISLQITGDFAGLEAAKPASIIEAGNRPRRAVSVSNRGISSW
ncbi:hypothetical protein KZC52_07495 [Microbacterium sp. kSW2-24]|uniref:hypothetical protein n=1 Tax=Microbacterium galbinum TaxID=2851646 RepID=UPI001FFC573B|nr:hypothetical protein [Microbacterium galbinum]MCK2022762.1 hypothetical protein [Microbacterium galbinum]